MRTSIRAIILGTWHVVVALAGAAYAVSAVTTSSGGIVTIGLASLLAVLSVSLAVLWVLFVKATIDGTNDGR